jgi:predicted RNase H-like HicB family nuclease
MRMELTAIYMQVEDGGYVALAKELWGVTTQGDTLDEARAMLEDAVRLMIEASRDDREEFVAENPDRPVIREKLIIDEPSWT